MQLVDRPPSDPVLKRLDAAISRARAALLWERAWPRLVFVLSLVALFLAVSWFGLWRVVPDWLRLGLVGAFAVAVLAGLVRLALVRLPSTAEAVGRVERDSGLIHRPAATLKDRLSEVSDDPAAQALWQAHRQRLLARLTGLRTAPPRSDMPGRDPNGWRFALPVLLPLAFAVGAGEHWLRVGRAFEWPRAAVAQVVPARIDAWIDPPAYTRQPPVFLTRRGEANAALASAGPSSVPSAAAPAAVRVPEGSRLRVRIVSEAPVEVAYGAPGKQAPLAPEEGAVAPVSQDTQAIRGYQAIVSESGTLTIRQDGAEESFSVAVVEDRPPTIRRGELAPNRAGSFQLDFTVEDDYGVAGGAVTFRPKATPDKDARPLVEAPQVPLRLDAKRGGETRARANARLESHPYAGLDVIADAVVTDAIGQEGRPAEDGAMVLPARPFRNPLARAIIEQRRNLALDARAQERVGDALDAIMLGGERFIDDAGIRLGLRVAYRRLLGARNDDALRAMLDDFWELALLIEDGELSDAQQKLAEAREALEKALENGASDEEIEKLMNELRQAMQELMQSMAEQMARQGEMPPMPLDPNTQMLSQQDLEKMMDRIEDLAKLGDRDAARQLLSELQQMMDNLQMAQRNMQMPQDGEMSEMMQQMEQLGRMMREQQRLMDDTFSLDQGRRPGERGQQGEQGEMSPEEMAEMMRQLQEGQSALAEQLQKMLEEMQQGSQGQQGQQGEGQMPGMQGMPQMGEGQMPGQGGEGQRSLGRAGRAMEGAAGSLGQGESGQAYGQQGEALQAMREGLQGMMQQMQQMMGQQGMGMQAGQQGPARGRTDPLGRPQRTEGPDLGEDVRVPDEIDVERAREILNAIRERLGERFRPRLELDYLERLLRTE